MRIYYLDSNAFSYCLGQPRLPGWTGDGLARLRAAIDQLIRRDAIQILGSMYHIEEASRISDRSSAGARKQFLVFYWQAIGWLLLEPTDDLVPMEVAVGRRLHDNEQFVTAKLRMQLKASCRNNDLLDEIGRGVEARVRAKVADLEARRDSARSKLIDEFANMDVATVTAKWWREAPARIADWVGDYLKSESDRFEFPKERALWPAPEALQTLWAIHAYMMARIIMNVGLRRRIGEGDSHDAHHYAAACYADVFVTNDKALRATIEMIPNPPIAVMSFDEFVRELGIPGA